MLKRLLIILARGIPTGYLNRLEARLAATEAMLFNALQQLPPGHLQHVDFGLQRGQLDQETWQAKRNKSDLVREWNALPLQTSGDLDAWYRNKLQGPLIETSVPSRSVGLFPGSMMDASPDVAEPLRWVENSDPTSAAEDGFGASPAAQFQVLPLIIESGEETQAVDTPESNDEQSKTSALLRRQDNMYF